MSHSVTSQSPSAPIIRRALFSVSDKTGIIELAQALIALNIELLSTGGTAQLLRDNNIAVTEVSSHTGFPEIMAGRVKTLHPKIHGGLLGRRGIDDDIMQQHSIAPIDLLVVNLYPFQQTIAQVDCPLTEAIENIDIGGPAMLRAAAKNHAAVTVVVDPNDYASVLKEMTNSGNTTAETRFALARKAFAYTAQYDAAISNYLGSRDNEYPADFTVQLHKLQDLRYGENPHQTAAFYSNDKITSGSIVTANQIQGKELSYNNIADTDAALECVKCFAEPACVIVKHANPCGVAIDDDLLTAYHRAFSTDKTSAFGGIIAFNRELDDITLTAILQQQFVEVIIAPTITQQAIAVAAEKKNVRLLACGALQKINQYDFKRVSGGLLIQQQDIHELTVDQLQIVSKRQPTTQELSDCLFAWKVAQFVKSNAIVYAKNNMTIGIGAGQMSRVISAKIASMKAAEENLTVAGSVMASDAFFPFRDGIDTAAKAGIRAVIQPGGSIRDDDVIAAADEADMAMIFTGIRHFRH